MIDLSVYATRPNTVEFARLSFFDKIGSERGIYLQGQPVLSLWMADEQPVLSHPHTEQEPVEFNNIRHCQWTSGITVGPRGGFLVAKTERTRTVLLELTLVAAMVTSTPETTDQTIIQQQPVAVVETETPRIYRVDAETLPSIFRRQRSLSDIGTEQPDEDLNYLALTIWAEARGEGDAGMRAVGHVIKNRADSGRARAFGSGIRGVVTHPRQFSCWNARDPNRTRMQRVAHLPEGKDKEMWGKAQQIAGEILNGQSADPTRNAVFYHTTAVRPGWASRVRQVARIGSHIFYSF